MSEGPRLLTYYERLGEGGRGGGARRYTGDPDAKPGDNLLAQIIGLWKTRLKEMAELERYWRERCATVEAKYEHGSDKVKATSERFSRGEAQRASGGSQDAP